jgi:Xaa-Pro aminopeptidase
LRFCQRVLRDAFPEADVIDALPLPGWLRARKNEDEFSNLRTTSDQVIDAMLAVIVQHGPGSTKRDLFEALRREETARGLRRVDVGLPAPARLYLDA